MVCEEGGGGMYRLAVLQDLKKKQKKILPKMIVSIFPVYNRSFAFCLYFHLSCVLYVA